MDILDFIENMGRELGIIIALIVVIFSFYFFKCFDSRSVNGIWSIVEDTDFNNRYCGCSIFHRYIC